MVKSGSLLELAARAAYAADWPEPHHASWDETADDMRDRYTAIAGAVLAAKGDPREVAAQTIDWQPIPAEVDTSIAPFDGDDYLIYADSATVDVVRLAFYCDGSEENWERGWWSDKHSVTTEHLTVPTFSHWAHFSRPSDIIAWWKD